MRQRIIIPPGTLVNDQIARIASDLVMCSYSVKKGKVDKGENKGAKYIEYWIDKKENPEDEC